MTRPLYIFDLDGTLALIEHRRHFVAPQEGSLVTVDGTPGVWCGLDKHNLGNVWVEFESTGKWSFSTNDVKFTPNWSAFFEACIHDEPNTPVINVLRALWRTNAEIWIFSGRSDEVYGDTMQWLNAHVAVTPRNNFWNLTMRRQGDYTADDVLKKQWLDDMLPVDRERLVAVFDDRDRVVKMWRDNGVPCFQVAAGEF
jgi:hypothetical protein